MVARGSYSRLLLVLVLAVIFGTTVEVGAQSVDYARALAELLRTRNPDQLVLFDGAGRHAVSIADNPSLWTDLLAYLEDSSAQEYVEEAPTEAKSTLQLGVCTYVCQIEFYERSGLMLMADAFSDEKDFWNIKVIRIIPKSPFNRLLNDIRHKTTLYPSS